MTGTITDLHGAGNWTSTGVGCLDITDMECAPDPEPVDATGLQVGPGDEEDPDVDNESSAEEVGEGPCDYTGRGVRVGFVGGTWGVRQGGLARLRRI